MSRAPSFVAALRETLQAAVGAAVGEADPPSQAELFVLLKQRQFQASLEMLRQHPQLWAARDDGGHTPLHWAALGGSLDFLRAALGAGVPVDIKGSNQQTPLQWAVCGGDQGMVEALLRARADILVRDSNAATLFIVALQQRWFRVAQALATHGREELLSASDRSGCTAAHWAAHMGDVKGLCLLEYLQAELHALDAEGMSPLHRAALAGHSEAVSFLVDRSGDVTLRSVGGKSCIDIMLQRGDRALQALLLRSAFRKQLRLKEQGAAPLPGGLSPSQPAEASDGVSAPSPKIATWAPVGAGIAACWRSGGGSIRDGAAGLADLQEAIPFDVESRGSREELLREVMQRLPDFQEAVVCLWATDAVGRPIDLLSPRDGALPDGCSPIRVRLLRVETAASQEAAQRTAALECLVTQRMAAQPELFNGRVLTLVPPEMRWEVWKEALQLHARELPSSNSYRELSQQENEWTQLIRADANRTFKGYDGDQRQCLLRILNAYAAHNAGVGYCQGMNRIAGLLLLLAGREREEECFGVLVCLMDSLGLAGFFREGFPLLSCYMDMAHQLLEERVPDLLRHFAQEGVEPDLYLRQWFLTLFIDCLPLPLVVSVWDAIIHNGLPFALRVAVALLEALKDTLLALHYPDHSVLADTLKVLREVFTSKGADGLWLGHLLVEYAGAVTLPESLSKR